MSLELYRRILGVTAAAGPEDLKAAYHALAKRNHPDLFPENKRHVQQLKMMKINEAYMSLVGNGMQHGFGQRAEPKSRAASAPMRGGASARADAAASPSDGAGRSPRGSDSDRPSKRADFASRGAEFAAGYAPSFQAERALAVPKDPAYAYYRRGFEHFSRGHTALFRKDPRIIRRQLKELRTYNPYILQLAAGALRHFERAYHYFGRVAQEYPGSPWAPDARYKLARLETFNRIYQKICDNLSRNAARKAAGAP